MPTILPPSGNPLRATPNPPPPRTLPHPLLPPLPLAMRLRPPGYKNSRITRIIPAVGIYGGSDAAAPAHAPQQFAGAGSGRVLEEGELAWANPGGRGAEGGNAYVISLGGARGEAIGRVFGEGGWRG
ncbi:hypothetical protein VC83_06602 [Pseudogymnoascus destructans]|uniref:Uncharacterized protein n=1 Tax=Pseudogymnoascus destructans TaxID=655981 RepID=A0A177AAH6_9PEZI|nr:uncharacterized protein VC83_06602 [Pseudogymnoascus destructans]OAF58412.1 hypothetical protein VC83_06602 [Pseudogymnoascus destructans]